MKSSLCLMSLVGCLLGFSWGWCSKFSFEDFLAGPEKREAVLDLKRRQFVVSIRFQITKMDTKAEELSLFLDERKVPEIVALHYQKKDYELVINESAKKIVFKHHRNTRFRMTSIQLEAMDTPKGNVIWLQDFCLGGKCLPDTRKAFDLQGRQISQLGVWVGDKDQIEKNVIFAIFINGEAWKTSLGVPRQGKQYLFSVDQKIQNLEFRLQGEMVEKVQFKKVFVSSFEE